MCWQLGNFIVKQVKFFRFLHTNEHLQRMLWHLVAPLIEGCQKMAIFVFYAKFQDLKSTLSPWNYFFHYDIGMENSFYKWHCQFNSFLNMVYLVEICPIFDGSQSNSFIYYQKILLGCSFGSKNPLNFNCHNMKFHNFHHTNVCAIVGTTTSSFPWIGRSTWVVIAFKPMTASSTLFRERRHSVSSMESSWNGWLPRSALPT